MSSGNPESRAAGGFCSEVAVALPVFQTYTYQVPDSLKEAACVGKRVLVPFGGRRVTGYVVGRAAPRDNLKQVLDVLDEEPLFPVDMVPFFRWTADYYLYPLGEVIGGALPRGLNVYEHTVFALTPAGTEAASGRSLTPLETDLLALLSRHPLSRRELAAKLKGDIPQALLHRMIRKGWLQKEKTLKGATTRPSRERYVGLPAHSSGAWISWESLSPARRRICEFLRVEGAVPFRRLRKEIPGASPLVRKMAAEGLLREWEQSVYRDPFGEPIAPDEPPALTVEQKTAVAGIVRSVGRGFEPFLLLGVTASGKTEVYLQAIAAAVARGFTALVLVPEIALISQVERRFRARFGECIAVLHSGLSHGERYDQWRRILKGEARIVIGARSAVFAPLERIGLIVVDEEHDDSYKQETKLLYNARDLAVLRGKLAGCPVVLGSATPSVQSYYNVTTRKFTELRLAARVADRPLPEILVEDLRQCKDMRGSDRFFTPPLLEAMAGALGRGEQVLLFLNRRGFASISVCALCGLPVKCKNCDITLTLHQGHRAMRCHFCGFSRAASAPCDQCGSFSLKHLGLGTERVEEAVKGRFPGARVARMDRDTTARKGSILTILKNLRRGKIDVLVGTQMVAKGHDFPNITLVGIICADFSLNFPDFRSGERTFQLLAQVAGRAGRGDLPGRVILQTYNPDHFSIKAARTQDYAAFYDQEVISRRALGYPPFARMVQLRVIGKDRDTTRDHAQAVGECCRELLQGPGGFKGHVQILGPAEAPLTRIANRFRWQILLKGSSAGILQAFIRRFHFDRQKAWAHSHAKVIVDVDPYFMM